MTRCGIFLAFLAFSLIILGCSSKETTDAKAKSSEISGAAVASSEKGNITAEDISEVNESKDNEEEYFGKRIDNGSTSWKVVIKDFGLEPDELRIRKEDTVVWLNEDVKEGEGVQHFITSHKKEFRSERFDKGEIFVHTFNNTGEFTYFDLLYKTKDSLRGRVIVSE